MKQKDENSYKRRAWKEKYENRNIDNKRQYILGQGKQNWRRVGEVREKEGEKEGNRGVEERHSEIGETEIGWEISQGNTKSLKERRSGGSDTENRREDQ